MLPPHALVQLCRAGRNRTALAYLAPTI